MATTTRDTTPYWTTSATMPQFAALDADTTADVAVVGGGVTGLTTAALLSAAGRSVIVLDRGRCALGDTGYTSAHLTMVTDTRLHELASRFGVSHAQAVWDAGLAAIAQIDELVRRHDIDADFEWVDGYLHLPAGADGAWTGAPARRRGAGRGDGLRRRVRGGGAGRRTPGRSGRRPGAGPSPEVSRRPGPCRSPRAASGSTSTARSRRSRTRRGR